MNKVVGMVGAISGLAALDGAQAATIESPNTALPAAKSYAELLEPIPNALAVLRAEAARSAQEAEADASAIPVQYRHHHHHNRWWRRHHHHHNRWWRRHHHHHNRWWRRHHHHSQYFGPGTRDA
jgi:hypothetical protein